MKTHFPWIFLDICNRCCNENIVFMKCSCEIERVFTFQFVSGQTFCTSSSDVNFQGISIMLFSVKCSLCTVMTWTNAVHPIWSLLRLLKNGLYPDILSSWFTGISLSFRFVWSSGTTFHHPNPIHNNWLMSTTPIADHDSPPNISISTIPWATWFSTDHATSQLKKLRCNVLPLTWQALFWHDS